MRPEIMKENLEKLGIAKKYTFERPGHTSGLQVVEPYRAVHAIMRDRTSFHTPYVPRVQKIFDGHASGYVILLLKLGTLLS
jgi:hypothetical protein